MPPDAHHLQGQRLRVREGDPDAKAFLMFYRTVDTGHVDASWLEVSDKRYSGVPLDVSFNGELRPMQKDAAKSLAKFDTGILAAGTAFGKTVLAAWTIAHRRVNTLILVNRKQLQLQWVSRLSQFLGIPEKEIGFSATEMRPPTSILRPGGGFFDIIPTANGRGERAGSGEGPEGGDGADRDWLVLDGL